MKLKTIFLASTALLLCIDLQAQASDQNQAHGFSFHATPPHASTPEIYAPTAPVVKSLPHENQENQKSDNMIGREVKNLQNQKLGEVTDLALDMENGRVVTVIVSYGGFLGLGEKMVGVPAGAFTNLQESGALLLNMTRKNFEAAPELKLSHWAEYFQSRHASAVYRYFGQEPYFGSDVRTGRHGGMVQLGSVERTGAIIGLTVMDNDAMLGKVFSIRVDHKTGRLLLAVALHNDEIYSKCEIQASAVRFNATHDALLFDATRPDDSHFKPFPGYQGSSAFYLAPGESPALPN